jgi:hypothetical protein
MAENHIVGCPSGENIAYFTSNANGTNYLHSSCSGNSFPAIVTHETYCLEFPSECEAEPDPGTGTEGGLINHETFVAFWPWALLMLTLAFGVRQIRRVIYSRG